MNRAALPGLKSHFEERVREERERYLDLNRRIRQKGAVPKEDSLVYFSSWQYAAIHVVAGMKGAETAEDIAKMLKLPLRRVKDLLESLVSMGLIKATNGKYSSGSHRIHLEKKSP